MLMKQVEKDVLLIKKLKKAFFEYYKQGFLFSNIAFNGGLCPTKSELSKLIIDDFNEFFDRTLEEHYLSSQDKSASKEIPELNLSDIINQSSNSTKVFPLESDKMLTTCPLCSKEIHVKDIDFEQIDLSKIKNFPFDYIHIHSHGEFPPHALLMYFDAHFKVRGRKVPKFTNLKS